MRFVDYFTTISLPHFGMVKLPRVGITTEQRASVGISPSASNKDFLLALARAGYKTREKGIPKDRRKVYGDRIKTELSIFDELGFTDYVLLVWQVINKARELGVFIDFGRGSCAGSAVFWLLGLSGVDPIDKGLLFERFVSRVRSKKQVINGEVYLQGDLIADADLNLGNGREKIVEWLKTEYPNAVCEIITHGTMSGKVLINDVYKAYANVSIDDVHHVSGMLESKYGLVEDIQDAYDKGGPFKEWADANRDIYTICLSLRDLIRQTGVHASGYVIASAPFDGTLPIQLNKNGGVMSSYNMQDISNFAVKLDLLGLVTNRVIKDTLDQTGLKVEDVNLDDDPFIYDRFQDGKLLPYGLYQISADCAYRVTQAVKPKNVSELSCVNAIGRPGALAYLQPYVDGKQECPHPLFESILKPTRNLCLYQEQMMQMAVAVGFTLDESEILRKIVGKKLVDKVQEWKQKVYDRVKASGLEERIADILWKILEDSANYSFNKSHSLATSYLSALTTYLKYKHSAVFMCACLNSTNDLQKPTEERAEIVMELGKLGVKLLPPDFTKSSPQFTVEDGNIRYGISYMKGVSETTMSKVSAFKREFKTKFEIFEAAKAAGVNISVLATLFSSGCLAWKDQPRSRLVLEAQLYNLLTDREKPLVHKLAPDYDEDLIAILKGLPDRKDEKGKPLIRDTRLATLRRDYAQYWTAYKQNSGNEELSSYCHERALLGFSYSSTLFKCYSAKIVGLTRLAEVAKMKDKVADPKTGAAEGAILPQAPTEAKPRPKRQEAIKAVCYLSEVKRHVSRKDGSPYVKMVLSDDEGEMKGMLFGNEKIDACTGFNGGLPKDGSIAIATGTLSKDKTLLFLDSLVVQPNPIALRKGDALVAI